MKLADFKKSGHWPTLLSAFLYFDISFMAWVSLGPLMVYIAKAMNIPIEQKLTLVAIPVLSGAILRIPMGILADTIGSKLTGTIAQAVMTLACFYVFVYRPEQSQRGRGVRRCSRSWRRLLRGGAAAGEPLVSAASSRAWSWALPAPATWAWCSTPCSRRPIAEHFGWQGVYGFLLIPMVADPRRLL